MFSPPRRVTASSRLRACWLVDRGGSKIELPEDAYTASVYGAYRTTSDITCALIEGDSDNAFLVALPDGEYTVWLIASDAEEDPPLFEVWANGQKKLDVRIPRRAFVFMEPFQAHAAGGQLRIDLKGLHGWILNGLVDRQGRARNSPRQSRQLERDIFFLTEPELPHWKEAQIGLRQSAAGTDFGGAGKGYVVFPWITRSRLCPRTRRRGPRLEGRSPLLQRRASSSRRLYAFALQKTWAASRWSCRISSARRGNPASRAECERRRGSVLAATDQRLGWQGRIPVVPELIEPPAGRACRVPAGQVKQWWLTVRVPPGTPAGRYRMSLTLRPEKAPPTVLEWRLLVLPFPLSRPADKHWGTWLESLPTGREACAGPERRGRNMPAEVDRLARADLVDYRDHGFDLAHIQLLLRREGEPRRQFRLRHFTRSRRIWNTEDAWLGHASRDRLRIHLPEPGIWLCGTRGGNTSPAHSVPRRTRPSWASYGHPRRGPAPRLAQALFLSRSTNPATTRPRTACALPKTSRLCPRSAGLRDRHHRRRPIDVQRLGDRVDVRIYAYGNYSRNKVLARNAAGPSVLVLRKRHVLRAQHARLPQPGRLRVPSLRGRSRHRLGLRLHAGQPPQ